MSRRAPTTPSAPSWSARYVRSLSLGSFPGGRAELLWSFESTADQHATYVALLGEEVVAFAGANFGRTAVYLGGAGTRQAQRGRGAYTALVHARWEAAVERGTPALTAGAGAMSRPILERLGFSIVGWADCLLDKVS